MATSAHISNPQKRSNRPDLPLISMPNSAETIDREHWWDRFSDTGKSYTSSHLPFCNMCAYDFIVPPTRSLPSRFPSLKRHPLTILPLDSIEEIPEYDCGHLNLGAESPTTPSSLLSESSGGGNQALVDEWLKSAPRVISRRPSWRTAQRQPTMRERKKDLLDRDCGIWCVLAYS